MTTNMIMYKYEFVGDGESTKVSCPCSVSLQGNGLSRHYETGGHLAWEYHMSIWQMSLECGCGETYTLNDKSHHLTSEPHKTWVKENLSKYSSRKARCCCGSIVNYKSLCSHRESKKHKKWVEDGNQDITDEYKEWLSQDKDETNVAEERCDGCGRSDLSCRCGAPSFFYGSDEEW